MNMAMCGTSTGAVVSIQLVSPARGEIIFEGRIPSKKNCFHSIGSPARGELKEMAQDVCSHGFPFNWFPLREGNRGQSSLRQ